MHHVKLIYSKGIHHYQVFRSDNPLDEIWSEILLICDHSILSRHYPGRTEEQYLFISTSLNQAYEYYLASKHVSLKTRPLLTYYSFLNLTRAAFVVLTGEEPDDYHGLCKPDIGPTLLDFSAKINKGVFHSLADLEDLPVPVNRIVSLGDFLMNSIELIRDYQVYFQSSSMVISPSITTYLDGDSEIVFPNQLVRSFPNLIQIITEKTRLLEDFRITENGAEIKMLNKEKVKINPDSSREDAFYNLMSRHFTFSALPDENGYLNLNENDKKVGQATAYYGVIFMLGTIVRYSPQSLHALLDDKKTSVRWFFQRMCDVSERVFPNLILNMMNQKPVKFGPHF